MDIEERPPRGHLEMIRPRDPHVVLTPHDIARASPLRVTGGPFQPVASRKKLSDAPAMRGNEFIRKVQGLAAARMSAASTQTPS